MPRFVQSLARSIIHSSMTSIRPLFFVCAFLHGFLGWAGAEEGSAFSIITLGDSITKGVRSGVTAEQTFASLLEQTLKQNALKVTVKNVGIGGERTDQALLRLDRDVISAKPRLVTIMYGTNDGYVDKGKTACRITADAYEANLREIVKRLQAAQIQPVLMTEPMFGEANVKNGLGEDCNIRLALYMERCRTVAKDMSVPLVDHFSHWGAMQKRKVKLQAWTTDGCHPNPAGHAEMAHRIAQLVLPIVQRAGAWAANIPFTPCGRKWLIATGTRICVWICGLSIFARSLFTT